MPAPPMRCAPMAARFTADQRPQPAFATRSRSLRSDTSAAAPLIPTAPARLPPNHAAMPTSCKLRITVLRSDIRISLRSGVHLLGVNHRGLSGRTSPRWRCTSLHPQPSAEDVTDYQLRPLNNPQFGASAVTRRL